MALVRTGVICSAGRESLGNFADFAGARRPASRRTGARITFGDGCFHEADGRVPGGFEMSRKFDSTVCARTTGSGE